MERPPPKRWRGKTPPPGEVVALWYEHVSQAGGHGVLCACRIERGNVTVAGAALPLHAGGKGALMMDGHIGNWTNDELGRHPVEHFDMRSSQDDWGTDSVMRLVGIVRAGHGPGRRRRRRRPTTIPMRMRMPKIGHVVSTGRIHNSRCQVVLRQSGISTVVGGQSVGSSYFCNVAEPSPLARFHRDFDS
jgi:hypothetical protein